VEECGPCPVFAGFTLAFALQLRSKHGKTSFRIRKTSVRIRKTSVRIRKTSVRIKNLSQDKKNLSQDKKNLSHDKKNFSQVNKKPLPDTAQKALHCLCRKTLLSIFA
jgi:hypothetical protein